MVICNSIGYFTPLLRDFPPPQCYVTLSTLRFLRFYLSTMPSPPPCYFIRTQAYCFFLLILLPAPYKNFNSELKDTSWTLIKVIYQIPIANLPYPYQWNIWGISIKVRQERTLLPITGNILPCTRCLGHHGKTRKINERIKTTMEEKLYFYVQGHMTAWNSRMSAGTLT
jgi:hypothetical protein